MTVAELLGALRAIDPNVAIDPETPPADEQAGFLLVQGRAGFTFADYYRDADGTVLCTDEQLDVLRDWLKGLPADDPTQGPEG